MILYGAGATAAGGDAAVRAATGWTWRTGGDQWLHSHGSCYQFNFQLAEHVSASRYHVRFWQMPGRDLDNRFITYATPHHEDFVIGHGCGFPGNHAIDQNGSQGSGFDQGRRRVTNALAANGHPVGDVQNWGNTQTFRQCDGGLAGSNGTVNWMRF